MRRVPPRLHPRPRSLVLNRRLDHYTQLLCRRDREIGVPQQLPSEEGDVCLARLEHLLDLRGGGEETDSADGEVGVRALDLCCKAN